MITPSRLAVIVLSWNNFEDSFQCLTAILENSYPNLWPILVDNGSTDGSFEKLKAAFPELLFIKNDENLGFSRGCNVGLRIAMRDMSCDYFMLLNNDCMLASSGIENAIQEMSESDSVGVVTGKILFNDGTNRIWHAGGEINTLTASANCRGMREVDIGQYDQACDTNWASGAMMIISRAVLTKVGLLPEEYFFGLEEWDYSLSVLQGGFRIRYVPQFVGHHHGDGSHNNHDPKFVYNYFRNKLIFQEKFHSKIFFLIWKQVLKVYVTFLLSHKIEKIKRQSSISSAPNIHGTDDIVAAAVAALKDHGKNELSEKTLLEFELSRVSKQNSLI